MCSCIILYNRSTLHDVEHDDGIYSCPYVHQLYPTELRDDNFSRSSSERIECDAS